MNVADDRQHPRIARVCGGEPRHGVEQTRSGHHHAGTDPAGGACIAVGHVGRRLLVARHHIADAVADFTQAVDGPVELHARNAEQIGDPFQHQLSGQRLAPGQLHGGVPVDSKDRHNCTDAFPFPARLVGWFVARIERSEMRDRSCPAARAAADFAPLNPGYRLLRAPTTRKTAEMKIIDMTQVMNVHTPGWVGYAGNKMYYAQNLQTQMIVAQRIDTALHVGTHFDGAMHATDDRRGDMASLPLDYLVSRGVVVDISPWVADWSVITPQIIERAGADIRDGDILVLHTGWHRHYEGRPQQDLVKYFCYHPGPNLDTLHWMFETKIKWWAMDTGSCDHAMNTSIRRMRPDLAAQFTKLHGKTPAEFFGTFEYSHKKSGRRVTTDVFPFHSWAFQEGLLHAENLGGDIELMLNRRALIGAFPWRYQGLEGCPCRIVAFLDCGEEVEAIGDAARAVMGASAF